MRAFVKFCMILLAGSIPAACSDKDDKTPEYKIPEGLHITTFLEAYKYQYVFSRNVRGLDNLLFYSDTFPVKTLEGATIAMVAISENQIIGFGLYDYGIYPDQDPYTTSTVLTKTCFISTEKSEEGIPVFPDCGESGTLFNIFFSSPTTEVTTSISESRIPKRTCTIKPRLTDIRWIPINKTDTERSSTLLINNL